MRGNITVVSLLEVGNYRITATARDGGSPTQTGTATVFIAVIPATPEAIQFTENDFTVREDAPTNTLVGIVQAFDHLSISQGGIVYSTPNVTECLLIDPIDGQVRVGCPLDREMDAWNELLMDSNLGNIFLVGTSVPAGDFKLTVVATDLGIPECRTSTELVLICVTRAPPPPLGFPTTKIFIAENEPVGGMVTLQTSSGADINPANYTNNLQFSG